NRTTVPGEGSMWDANSDTVMYSLGNSQNHAAIVKYDLQKGNTSVVADFSKAPYNFTSISGGGTGEGSKDSWLTFFAPNQQQACAYSINDSKAYCADLKSIPGGAPDIDYATMSRGVDHDSGKRYLVIIAKKPPFLVFSVNTTAGRLDLE